MEQSTVNQRVMILIERYAKGNKSAFAKSVGMSNQSLGEIVGGRQNAPSFSALQKIALAYPDISLDWLVLGQGQMIRETKVDLAQKIEAYVSDTERFIDINNKIPLEADESSLYEHAVEATGLWQLQQEEEVARIEFTNFIERERQLKTTLNIKSGSQDESDIIRLANIELIRKESERRYITAARNRIRAERAMLGFNTNSSTAIYTIRKTEDTNALYGGLLTRRLGISDETAERLIQEGKIRATYIDGEGYRITEQAVRIFLGEF